IKVHKDMVPRLHKTNVVYKIDCADCDASYVGQTSRKLSTRISEHRLHIGRNTSSRSVITDHRLSYNHDFKWDDITVLDNEPNLYKRILSEVIFIKRQTNGLNFQTDTECLPDSY
ncbi:hypothetical protein EAG_04622, partial [Camponotus floridanus]